MIKFRTNPDLQQYQAATEAVRANGGYCPCALEKNDNTLCMCKDFITNQPLGPCHCGRYVKYSTTDKVRVYLASQIFAECWRDYNDKVAKLIAERFPNIELYVPQNNKSINDKTRCASAEDIVKGDFCDNLDIDDIMIAIVDGDTPGIGTTVEVGYFARRCQEEIERQGYTNKKIISLYTDTRECAHTVNDGKIAKLHEFAESQFSYINLLLVGTLKRYGVMCRTIDEVLEELEKALEAFEK